MYSIFLSIPFMLHSFAVLGAENSNIAQIFSTKNIFEYITENSLETSLDSRKGIYFDVRLDDVKAQASDFQQVVYFASFMSYHFNIVAKDDRDIQIVIAVRQNAIERALSGEIHINRKDLLMGAAQSSDCHFEYDVASNSDALILSEKGKTVPNCLQTSFLNLMGIGKLYYHFLEEKGLVSAVQNENLFRVIEVVAIKVRTLCSNDRFSTSNYRECVAREVGFPIKN